MINMADIRVGDLLQRRDGQVVKVRAVKYDPHDNIYSYEMQLDHGRIGKMTWFFTKTGHTLIDNQPSNSDIMKIVEKYFEMTDTITKDSDLKLKHFGEL